MNQLAPQPAVSFMAHEGGTTSASFSPDGATLATGGYDCITRLWDVNTWHEKQTLPGHRRGHVAYAPDGCHLISGGLHKNADVFDTSAWQIVKTLDDSGGVWSIAFTPDGSRCVIIQPINYSDPRSHRPIEFWDTQAWTVIETVDVGSNYATGVAFSPNGEFNAIQHSVNGLVSVWSADFTSELVSFPAHVSATFGLAYSPDGKTLATGGADNVARLWDTSSWEMRHKLPDTEAGESVVRGRGVLCVAFSPDGQLLATGGLDGMLTVWRL